VQPRILAAAVITLLACRACCSYSKRSIIQPMKPGSERAGDVPAHVSHSRLIVNRASSPGKFAVQPGGARGGTITVDPHDVVPHISGGPSGACPACRWARRPSGPRREDMASYHGAEVVPSKGLAARIIASLGEESRIGDARRPRRCCAVEVDGCGRRSPARADARGHRAGAIASHRRMRRQSGGAAPGRVLPTRIPGPGPHLPCGSPP
jgi:hypothetical protein